VIHATSSGPAVVVDRLSKRFRIPQERSDTLKERVLRSFRRTRYDVLDSLRDVSFSVQPGEFFGVMGRNGSGKSTLLKCVAGIYRADGGHVRLNGHLSTFIELGVGFNPDLAAHDNVVLNAIMHGLTRREARARVDRVIDFAELHDFVDLKLKNYSSGMYVRLAFAVMIQVDADILLIDEVLAVGDAAFQHKCYGQFERMRDEGRTILFVTHDVQAVNRFCHRALLLERGEVVTIGHPNDVTGEYLAINFREERGADATELIGRLEDRAAFVSEAWFEDEQGDRFEHLAQGRQYVCKVRCEFNSRLVDPTFMLAIETEDGQKVFATSSAWTGEPTGSFDAGDQVIFSVAFENFLAAGRYYVSPQILLRAGGKVGVVDRRDRAAAMVVSGLNEEGALVDIPYDLRLERVPARELSA
jgi:ABC-type polysaccharide/polyol phosphate transport system ATPase subunit